MIRLRHLVGSLIGLACVLLLQNCQEKEPPGEMNVTLFPQELRDMFYFKAGSWWVYEDSASGILDTVRVTYFRVDTFTHLYDKKVNGIYEGFTLETFSSYYGYKFIYEFIGSVLREHHFPHVTIEKTKPLDYAGGSYAVFFPFVIGDRIYTGSPGTYLEIQNVSDSIIIDGKSIPEKTVYTYDDRCSFEHSARIFYGFTNNIGLTSKRVEHIISDYQKYDKNWKLKYYSVIR